MGHTPPVPELTGIEGGVWLVTTAASSYTFDLVRMTVVRHAGPTATTSINDQVRPIRSIDCCRVGELGRWTMHAPPWSTLDYFWQVSTTIVGIDFVSTDTADRREADHAP